MRGPFVSQDFKDNDGTADHMHRQFRIDGRNLFTDVAGLPLRQPSGLSYIEIRAVIRFKNIIPKTSHQIFEHMHGILSKICLQNFLHG